MIFHQVDGHLMMFDHLQGTGPLPVDQIKTGMFLEVQLDLQPDCVWPVKIIENVGGRLLLRYEAMETAVDDFWLFYLHPRLHLIGWGKENGCRYHPPEGQYSLICSEKFMKEFQRPGIPLPLLNNLWSQKDFYPHV